MRKELKPWFYLILAAVAAAGIVFPPHHAEHWWMKTGIFNAAFGLAACAVLIHFSASLWNFLKRPEDPE